MENNNWTEVTLRDLVDIKHGFAFQGEYFTDKKMPDILLTPGNFAIGGGYKGDKLKYYFGEVPNDYILSRHDLIVTMTDLSKDMDTLGYSALVPEQSGKRFLHNQRLGKVIIRDEKQVDKYFLYYLLRTEDYRNEVRASASGSVIKHTSPDRIRNYKFLLPTLPEQRAIARILGALDDKIELNRRMNRTLEYMARAVFRQWFVNGEEVNSWEVMNIEQVAERVAMGPFGSSIKVETFVEEGIPIISGQHLRSFMLQDATYNFISLEHAERLKKANVQRGDIIFTHAGNVGNLAFIPEDSKYDRYVVSQRQFYMRCNPEFVTPTFITFYFQSPEGKHKLLANMSSVGVPSIAQPVSYLRSIELPIPPKPLLDEFENFVLPLLKKYRANEKESRTLGSLRDSLLPKLMRGEVRVRDVEKL